MTADSFSGMIDLAKYECPGCGQSEFRDGLTLWTCRACGLEFACVDGIPKLYVEENVGQADRKLRDNFYGGIVGTHYQQVMPFLTLPARPMKVSWKVWVAYTFIIASLVGLVYYLSSGIVSERQSFWSASTIGALIVFGAICYFFYRNRPLFYLLVLAIPVKISLALTKFQPSVTFAGIHQSLIRGLSKKDRTLQVLDIATGSCNSLYRHGWMKLNAHYTGLDLSETMLLQGRHFMSRHQVSMDFVLADAAHLPFRDESFDVVLNYGALNGFTDPGRALKEMARVVRKDGVVLFFDEQLYQGASFLEGVYFNKVLSSHNIVHHCPVELVPSIFTDVQVNQVYQFYYLCLCRKE